MTARVNSAEGGTNGVAVTTGNSGGLSGDAWNSMSVPSGQSITFATAAAQKGSLGYRMALSSTSGAGANVRWTLSGWPSVRARWYMKFSAYPSAFAAFSYVTDASNTDAIAWFRLSTSGKLVVQNDKDAELFRTTASLALNTWYRIELIVVPGTTTSNGTIKFAFATGDGAVTESYSNTSADTDVYGNLGRLYVGKLDGTWNATVDFDDFAADDIDVATFLGASSAGPVVVDPTPPPAPDVPVTTPPGQYAEAIRNSLSLSYSVTATYAGSPVAGATGLAPTGGSITDTTKPGVRRVLNLELAGGNTLFEALSPTGTLLAVSCTVTYTDRRTEIIPMGVFDIDSDRLSEGDGKISLTAPDKWVRIQRAKFLVPTSSLPGQAVTAQITDLIRGALGADEPVTVTATSAASVGALTWEKDRDKAINDLAEQIGAWVYFDRQGEAIIADIPVAGRSQTWLADASLSGVMTGLTRERSRTDTFNVVVVESSSAEAELFPTTIVWDDNVNSPTYAGTDPLTAPETAAAFGIVTDFLPSANLSTAAEAEQAGLARLARGQGLAFQVSLEQVPNPAVDAFDSIDVLPPPETFNTSRVLERHVVDTVTHPLTLGPAQQIEGRSVRVAS